MTTAEFLPDNMNMVNEDGDVVAIDHEPIFEDVQESDPEPLEARRSPNFFTVIETIEAGIEKSVTGGYLSIKIGNKPLGQYLAVDIFKVLPNDEAKIIIEKYAPRTGEILEATTTTRRAIGGKAIEFAAGAIYPDVRMMAANDDTFKD